MKLKAPFTGPHESDSVRELLFILDYAIHHI